MHLLWSVPVPRPARGYAGPGLALLGALHALSACGPTEPATPAIFRCENAGAFGEIYVPEDCATLAEAVDAMVGEGTVLVGRGVYTEAVEVSGVALTFTARDGVGTVVMDAAGEPSAVSAIGGASVTVEGFIILGASEHVVAATGASLTLEDVELRDSTGSTGVGAYAGEGGELTLTGVHIEACAASVHGGAIAAVDGTVTGTDVTLIANTSAGPGALVWAEGSAVVDLTGGEASGNVGVGVGGLAYGALEGGSVGLHSVVLDGNTPGTVAFHVEGGAFALDYTPFDAGGIPLLTGDLTTLSLSHLELSGSGAVTGSAAVDVSAVDVVLDGSTVTGNAGPEGAIALRIADEGSVSARDAVFEANAGAAKAGALFVHCFGVGDDVTLSGSLFTANTAASGAGALRLEGCDGRGGTFVYNQGVFGGAAGLFDGASLAEVIATGNTAIDSGGAIHIGAPTGEALPITVEHAWLVGNGAVKSGGGVNLRTSPTNLRGIIAQGNTANLGGGIYSYGARTQVSHVTIVDNTVTGGPGGGLYLDGGNLTVKHAIFSANHSLNVDRDNLYVKAGTADGDHNLFYGAGQDGVEGLTLGSTDLSVDPQLLGVVEGAFTFASAHLSAGSPAVDKGDATEADPDGGASDLGALGGPDAGVFDLDGDGVPGWYWPGSYVTPPAGVSADGFDCDDLDGDTALCGP